MAFEPQNPTDPTALVINTTDTESGVAGGTVTISGPGLTGPTALPTSFDGSHLLARFDDAGLHGAYTFTATSCDNVGNCASTSQVIDLPVRLSAISDVSFAKIQSPAKIVRERVLVDYRYRVERRRRHKRVRVKGRRPLPAYPDRHPRQHQLRASPRQGRPASLARGHRLPSAQAQALDQA